MKKINLSAIFILLLLFTVGVYAQFDSLSGPLPKVVSNNGKPYLVVSDIEVPFGKTVTIESGCILLFQNFTGFQVNGQLIAEGSRVNPIIFTSEFDGRHSGDQASIGNPFDWNGITIQKDGFGTRMKFCKVQCSVYGINSETKLIRLDPCVFSSNGKANLTIIDSLHIVHEKVPYSYVLTTRDATEEGVSIKLIDDPQSKRRNTLRYTGLAAFALGGATGIYEYMQYVESDNILAERSSTSTSNTGNYSSKDWKDAETDRKTNAILSLSGATVALLGTVGFIWTFTF